MYTEWKLRSPMSVKLPIVDNSVCVVRVHYVAGETAEMYFAFWSFIFESCGGFKAIKSYTALWDNYYLTW